MAVRTITTMQYLIKEHYTPEFNEDFIYRNNEVLEKIYKNKVTAMGSPIQGPIRLRRASGSTAPVSEGGAHPTAAVPTDYQVQETLKIIDTHKEVSQLSINLTRSGNLNYRTALADNIEDALGEHADALNRYMFNLDGYMATCAASGHTSSTVIRMDTGTNMRQFYKGQAVAVLLKSSGLHNSVGVASDTIADIGLAGGLSSAYDIELTSGVAVYGSLDQTYGVCGPSDVSGANTSLPHGLPDLIGDVVTGPATLHGVTIATYPEFASYCMDKSGGDVGLVDIQEGIDNVELVSKGTVDMLILSDTLYRIIQFDIADPQIQRTPGQGLLGTGPIRYKGRSNKPIPIYIAAYCNPTDYIYGLDSSAITPYSSCFAEWMDDDGKYITKYSGYRKYECSLGTEIENLAHFRSRMFKIDNCNLS